MALDYAGSLKNGSDNFILKLIYLPRKRLQDQEKMARSSREKKFKPKSSREVRDSLKKVFAEIGQVDMLQKQTDGSATLSILPRDARYEAQNRGEVIVYIIRKHLIVLIPKILQLFGMLILPIIVIFVLGSLDAEVISEYSSFVLGIVIFWYIVTLTFSVQAYLSWYYDTFIITNQRIIDIDANKLDASKVSGTSIGSVEDVTVIQAAVLQNIFDFGDVEVQTAAVQREFEMFNVPNPRIIQDTILDLKVGKR